MNNLGLWLGFTKFVLGTFVLGLVTTFVNKDIQDKEVALKEIEQRRSIEMREQDQLGKFIQHALAEDVGVRLRFSQYFSTVTRSKDLRDGWVEYNEKVKNEYAETQNARDELLIKIEQKDMTSTELVTARKKITALENMLNTSPKSSINASSSRDIQLTNNIYLSELIASQTAERKGIVNQPNGEAVVNLYHLSKNILEPIITHFQSDLIIESGYRNIDLNKAMGGRKDSQHILGKAASIEVNGVSNHDLACWIKEHLDFDALSLFAHREGEPYSGWVEVSYSINSNRKNTLSGSKAVECRT